MCKPTVSVLLALASIWMYSGGNVTASANGDITSSIFVSVPDTGQHQLWRFDASAPIGTRLGDYSIPASAQSFERPTLKISPDGRWLASGWISAEPPLKLELGRIGEALTPVNAPGEALDSILEFGFSPDSRYFTYTLYTEVWTLGIIDLQSGKKAEVSDRAVTMPPDIDVSAPFGKMIPVVAAWSADSQTIYFETFLMLGCRGPHALYSAKVSALLGNTHTLPRTTLVSPRGADVFSYAFSPDRAYLALAYDDGDCGEPTKLGVIDLQTNRARELITASPGRAILVLGWADKGKTVVFASDPTPEGDSGPGFPLTMLRPLRISRSGGGPDRLPDLTADADAMVENFATSGNAFYYTIATDVEGSDSSRTLYKRMMSGLSKNATVLARSAHEISVWLCGDTLYFATTQDSIMVLYRTLPGELTVQKLREAPQIDFAGCGS
jgi:hypothetical protein